MMEYEEPHLNLNKTPNSSINTLHNSSLTDYETLVLYKLH